MKDFDSPRKDNTEHRKAHECPPGTETHHALPPSPEPEPKPAEPQPKIKYIQVKPEENQVVKGSHPWWKTALTIAASVGLTAVGMPYLTGPATKLIQTIPEKPKIASERTIPAQAIPHPSMGPDAVTVEMLRLQGQVADLQGQVDTLNERQERGVDDNQIKKLRYKVKRHSKWIAEHDALEDKLLTEMEAKVTQLERKADVRERRLTNYWQ